MAKASLKLGELIDSLLDRHQFPADCRELSKYLTEKGFKVSHSSLYAWGRGTQGISENNKISFANVLGLDFEKFNAYLDDRISLEQLEAEGGAIPLSEKEVVEWVLDAEPEALLYVQKHITEQLTRYFDAEFTTLSSVLEYALNQLAETAIAESAEEGNRLTQDEAIAQALQKFSESSGVKVKDLEAFLQAQKVPSSRQVDGIADAIGWEAESLQELIDRNS